MNRKFIVLVAALVLIIGGIVLLSKPQSSKSPIVSTSNELASETAPNFELESFSGQKVKLSDFAGKAVVLDFWSSWCPFCVEEMSELQTIQEEFKDQVVVVGVHRTATESKDQGTKFAKERGVSYLLLQDPSDGVYRAYTKGRNFMPFAVYIDQKGKIVATKAGAKTAEEMRREIIKLLP